MVDPIKYPVFSAVAGASLTFIASAAWSQATTLPAIKVTETAEETASGPVDGYVAKRSATGTKTDAPLLETPFSISVVTREQIEAQGADSLDQAFEYTAGIFSLGGGANRRGSTGFTVRGFNVTGSAPLYVNGSKFPINSLSGAIEPFGAERLELLKGPASILYGQAAPGGLINVVTKRPTAAPFGSVELEIGSFDRRQAALDLAGPMSDSWGYRVTALTRDSDTMVDYINDDRVYVAPTVTWRPGERTSLTLLAAYYDNETVYDYGKPFEGTVTANPNGRISRHRFIGEPDFNRFDTEGKQAGYLFEHQFNDTWSVRQNALYFDYESDYRDVAWGSWVAANATTPAFTYVNRSPYTRVDGDDGYSVDTQVQAFWETGRLQQTFLFGVDYSDRNFDRLQYSATVAPLNVFAPTYGSSVTLAATPASDSLTEATQLGFYFQDHLKLDERWLLLLGGRWDEADNDVHNRRTGAMTPTDADAFTGRAGLLYLFKSGFAPYVSYSESFQPASDTDFFGNAFEPTTGQQFEAGVKFEPPGRNASVTLAVYEITQQNVSTSDPDHTGYSIQTGEVRSRGVELEGRAHFNDQISLVGAITRIDAEITKSNGVDLGRVPMGVPDGTASLWADYHLKDGFADGLGLGAGVRFVDKSYNNTNVWRVPSYVVFDAGLNYRHDQWRFGANLKNVFDKNYLASCTFACFYGDERTLTVTAKYDW